MAKATIAFSKARGKVGGLVFRHDAGVGTIVSEYNPHPANPRTLAQTKQRNKMNLAGRMSKITPYEVIAGLALKRRKARTMFVSSIIRSATYIQTPTATSGTCSLLFDELKLSKGLVVNVQAEAELVESTSKAKVTLTGNTADNGIDGCIVVAYIAKGPDVFMADFKKANAGTSEVEFDFSTYDIEQADEGTMLIYVIPIRHIDGETTVWYQNLGFSDGGYATMYAASLASAGAYAESIYAGSVTYAE